jgi:hypothetical protein
MAKTQFEINKGAFIMKCGAATLLGSLSVPLVSMIFYGAFPPEAMLLCIPICGYQLPAYLISGMVGISLFERGRIRSAMTAYLGVGFSGWLISTLLLFIMGADGSSSSFVVAEAAVIAGLPSLLLYLVFLFPKRVNKGNRHSQ